MDKPWSYDSLVDMISMIKYRWASVHYEDTVLLV